MRLHERYLFFGVAQAVLAVLALGVETALPLGDAYALSPLARVLLFAGAPALVALVPFASSRFERALAGVLVAASGLAVGSAFHAALLWDALGVFDVAGRFAGALVIAGVLRRVRARVDLGDVTLPARVGFIVTGLVTGSVPAAALPVAGIAFLATLGLLVAHIGTVDARHRVPGAFAAGVATNPFVPAFTLVALGVGFERATGIGVDWPALHAEIVLVALVLSALAPGVILWAKRE